MKPAESRADIAVIGAGAAGLMASIWAGRRAAISGANPRIIVLDGAKKPGAKILVAGGGRCNVTHDVVDETAFAGSSRHAVRRVLGRFEVPETIQFFRELGVELKREETGKLFPVTDNAHTVLDALLGATRGAGVELVHPWRVASVEKEQDGFVVQRSREEDTGWKPVPLAGVGAEEIHARRVILATGGKSLPKTGSDGHGYTIAKSLGHTITPRLFPGLVPLTLPKDHFICSLSGLTVPATIELRAATGKVLVSFTDSLLCTHFGLSGPAVLDVSRYWTDATRGQAQSGLPVPPVPKLFINWTAGTSLEELDRQLVAARGVSIARWLTESVSIAAKVPGHADARGLPERLARALCAHADLDPATLVNLLTRDQRRAIAAAVTQTDLPITGDRGFLHAEVTAGGVPLSEVRLETMESRLCPGLHLCGEICDVDGRIGGYNFQWAWASGFVAGTAAASLCSATKPNPV